MEQRPSNVRTSYERLVFERQTEEPLVQSAATRSGGATAQVRARHEGNLRMTESSDEPFGTQGAAANKLHASPDGTHLWGKVVLGGPPLRIEEATPQDLGDEGERIAAAYLEMQGYELLERNWTCPAGEADLIALDDDTLVLIEVKTRLARSVVVACMPELAVDWRKRERYRNIAACYLQGYGHLPSVRFDVIAITFTSDATAKLHHLVDAFECDA